VSASGGTASGGSEKVKNKLLYVLEDGTEGSTSIRALQRVADRTLTLGPGRPSDARSIEEVLIAPPASPPSATARVGNAEAERVLGALLVDLHQGASASSASVVVGERLLGHGVALVVGTGSVLGAPVALEDLGASVGVDGTSELVSSDGSDGSS